MTVDDLVLRKSIPTGLKVAEHVTVYVSPSGRVALLFPDLARNRSHLAGRCRTPLSAPTSLYQWACMRPVGHTGPCVGDNTVVMLVKQPVGLAAHLETRVYDSEA